MNVRDGIEGAIASLCDDICTHYDPEENKTRADAVAVLVAALRLAPEPVADADPVQPEQPEEDTEA